MISDRTIEDSSRNNFRGRWNGKSERVEYSKKYYPNNKSNRRGQNGEYKREDYSKGHNKSGEPKQNPNF